MRRRGIVYYAGALCPRRVARPRSLRRAEYSCLARRGLFILFFVLFSLLPAVGNILSLAPFRRQWRQL